MLPLLYLLRTLFLHSLKHILRPGIYPYISIFYILKLIIDIIVLVLDMKATFFKHSLFATLKL